MEVLDETFCQLPCCQGSAQGCLVKPCPTCEDRYQNFTCGGPKGRISVIYDFAAPVTIGLNVYLKNDNGENTLEFPKNNKNHNFNSKKVVLIGQKPIIIGSYFHVFFL